MGPALAILAWFLAIPTFRTLYLSFMDANSFNFVGITNYIYAFTDRIMLEAFRNNLLWLVFGTSLSVGLGLLIAVLADRSRFENIYKAIIFMPMAISFVGAGLVYSGVTDTCGMALLLARMPWNRGQESKSGCRKC